jgi:hypothetical protein
MDFQNFLVFKDTFLESFKVIKGVINIKLFFCILYVKSLEQNLFLLASFYFNLKSKKHLSF